MTTAFTSIELSNLHNTNTNLNLVSCKFCLDDIDITDKSSYIIPCKCKGTIQYIHPTCMLQFFSFYKTTTCSLCMTTFRFIRWYHYCLAFILSLAFYFSIFYVFFNLQILALLVFNRSYTYKELVLFKLSKYSFVFLDFWVSSLILIMINLILNNGPQLNLGDIKTLATLPFLSIKLTFKTVLFNFVFYLIKS